MLKVMTIVGTRPELIKMSRVISTFDKFTNHVLVHTGQNYDYELNGIFFDDLGIRKPDHFLEVAGKNAAKTISSVIDKADEVFDLEEPDALLLYGDTNSCLSVIPAKRRKIPVFHMEAGNRCFDQRVPEELNRKVIDHLSDINMVLSEHARQYLISEGVRPETVIKTGSHLPEVLGHMASKVESSPILKTLKLESRKYVVLSAHREENVDDPQRIQSLRRSIEHLIKEFDVDVVFSAHPRTLKSLEGFGGQLVESDRLKTLKPFGFSDYIKLQREAFCVISDSGTVTEEASLIGFPAVTIRQAHERPEGMDASVLVMSDIIPEELTLAVQVAREMVKQRAMASNLVADYGNSNCSMQILNLVVSYTGYVNRTVWKRGE